MKGKVSMKKNKDIETKLQEVFESLDQINEVNVSASFKHNVLAKIADETKEEYVYNWFTPQLQLAVVIVVLLINVSVIMYSFSSSTDTTSISSFAESYHLTNTSSILNQY